MISYIWAMDEQRLIGNQNAMPWHLPNDLANFKKTTLGSPIVMGRKTYDSLGRPLPGRDNIVLTRKNDFQVDGVKVFHSIQAVIDYANEQTSEVFVIGGAEIFVMLQDYVSKLYVTEIHKTFEGDTYFPEWDWSQWTVKSSIEGTVNEKNKYPHTFLIYERIEK
ncbi:dihydrofolate reductase [Bacillus spongiae]|uniref:Dihydrofolate reductase n=1 Tax=Bacillus spongiae TaxID=2683610 RepID=A0ABU8HDN7_9BACI